MDQKRQIIDKIQSEQARGELEELKRIRDFLRQVERLTNRFDDRHPVALLNDPISNDLW